ncbi:MAG: hypothetical protein KDC95_23400, partial [Planctomycetes bacterium]|nr:hypothetical protein [Planctomycetota bacterium]
MALEAVIPLHNLPGFEPGTREIGFNIAYGDRDEGRGNYNYLVWAGSRSPAESTGWFGRLVFDGPAPLVPREAATGGEDGSQVLTFLGALLPAVSVLILLLVVRHVYRRSIAMHPTRQRIVLGAALVVAFAAVLVPFVVATLRSSELRARSDSIVQWVVSKLPDLERSGLAGFEGPSRDAPFVDLLTGGAVRKPLESDFVDLQTLRPDAFGWKRRDLGGGTVVWPYDVELQDAPLRVGLAGLRAGDRLRLVVSQPRSAPAEVDGVPNVAAHDDADVPRAPVLWVEAASVRSDLECVRMAALGGGLAPSPAAVTWSADFELPQGVREVSIGTSEQGSVTIEGVCARGREQVTAWRPIFLETVSRLGSGVRTSLVGAAPLAARIKLERGQSWTCELTPAVERVDRLWVLAAGLAGDDFRATKDGAVVAKLHATMADGTAAEWSLRHQVELFARRLDANSELQRLTTDTRARVAYEWESMDGATQVTPGVAFDLPDLSSVRTVTLTNDGNYPIELRSIVCAIPRVIDSDTGPESLLVPAERIGAYRLAPNALSMLGDASFHVFRDRVLSQPEGDASRRMPAELADDLQRDGAASTVDFFGDGSFESWVRLDGEGWGAAAFCVSVRDPTLGSVTRSVWIFGLIVALLAVPWLVVHFLFAVAPRASMRAQLLGSVAFAAIVPLAIVSVFVNNLLEQNQSERQRNNLLDDLGVASRRIEELGRTLVLEASDQAEAIADIVRRPRAEGGARFEDELAAALATARPKGFSDASFLTCEVPDESSRERVLRVVDRPES